jgi:hypothetical protein
VIARRPAPSGISAKDIRDRPFPGDPKFLLDSDRFFGISITREPAMVSTAKWGQQKIIDYLCLPSAVSPKRSESHKSHRDRCDR